MFGLPLELHNFLALGYICSNAMHHFIPMVPNTFTVSPYASDNLLHPRLTVLTVRCFVPWQMAREGYLPLFA
jgi:hypothetical protein